MPRSVAFFRNLNLGQNWSPTRPQLVGAFEAAGATGVDSVQVNGTVVFTHRAPARAVQDVLARLQELTGYGDIAIVRSAAWVADLARRLGELDLDPERPTEVVLFDAPGPVPVTLPWTAPNGRVTLLVADDRHAIAQYVPEGPQGTSAGMLLQQLTGVKTTGRVAGTMLRLARRLEGRA